MTTPDPMSNRSKKEYLEQCRWRYARRERQGKGVLIDEVCETMGWSRKRAIKALNARAGTGGGGAARGRRKTYGEEVAAVVVSIWKAGEQPCGTRLRAMLPEWLASYEKRHGRLGRATREKVVACGVRTLERMTAPLRIGGGGRAGRCTGRRSHRLKQKVEVRCGPWEVEAPGWMEADTVSHGGGSSGGEFLHSLTLTDIHSGWTQLAALWGLGAGGVCQALDGIEAALPFAMRGFDCDNGSEFLNGTLESWLAGKRVHWTRSRPYRKNDQAHVEQKNFTHVRQLLGYGRYGHIELVDLVNDLYGNAWLPLRNHFTPVMKLVEKKRVGTRWKKRYDEAATPYQRLLACPAVGAEVKRKLRGEHGRLDPFRLAESVEEKLGKLHDTLVRLDDEDVDQG